MEKEPRNENEQEQTPEQIRVLLEGAIEKMQDVLLTQATEKGDVTNPATPISLDGSYLEVEADGYGFSIIMERIKRAEIIQQEKK